MNYKTKNSEILHAMKEIFGDLPNSKNICITADYSQAQRLTYVSIQIESFPLYHNLIFHYTRSGKLYDVIKYRNKTVIRLGQLTQVTPQIQLINDFILKHIPKSIPQVPRKVNELAADNDNSQLEIKKAEIEMLKDKLKSSRSQIDSLRNKITMLSKMKKALNSSKR